MTRLPTLRPRELIAALNKAGFHEHHQRGSHVYLWHPIKRRMTAVPMHTGDLPRGLMSAIIKQAGLSEEQLLELL